MQNIFGRKIEIALLQSLKNSKKSEFVAIYGRRRVGKTFMVRKVFKERFSFQLSGVANVGLKQHLTNFHNAFLRLDRQDLPQSPPKDWFEAFNRLSLALEKSDVPKKIIFLDELPWLDTPQSNFIPALEYFWNSWASARSDVLLIVCGSAASWIINQLINNRGGLHNRVTERILLKPFTLSETEAFLKSKGGNYDRYQLLELYMVMGGVPFYLESIQVNRSVAQNIDRLFFTEGGLLAGEYVNLYRSLFKRYEKHTSVVEALSQKAGGLSRSDILEMTKLPNGGSTTSVLDELEQSGFIRRYLPFGKGKRDSLYQLVDQFTLFYLNFVKDNKAQSEGAWLAQLDSHRWQAWSGYAFESLCRYHVDAIKKHLGIAGVYTEISTWRSQKSSPGAQIDLVIDRKDRVINLCEIKFSIKPFTISKSYAETLRNKIMAFRMETGTKKTIFLTIIAANGLAINEHSQQLVQDSLDMNALFE
ncbi:MAG: ATP-binding protein [Saprospiraceae bacterium]|nr:ATP-binding protein [Saprospiraceae bacterium]